MDLQSIFICALPFLFLFCNFGISYSRTTVGIPKHEVFSERVFICVFAATLIFLTGFRSIKLSTDYGNYKYILSTLRNISFSEIPVHNGEWIFAYFYKLCGIVFNYNVIGFMVIIAILTVIPICAYFFKEGELPWLSALLLVTLGSYWTSFNTVRQYFAASLFIFAYKYIKERKFFKFFLVVFVLAGIHASVLMMIPFYWLLNIRWNFRKPKYLILLIFLLFTEFTAVAIMRRITIPAFVMKDLAERSSFINIIRPLILFSVFILFRKNLNLKDRDDRFLFNSSFFYTLMYGLTLGMKVFQRWSYFLIFPPLIAVPNVIKRVRDKQTRGVMYSFYVVFALAYSLYTLKNGEPYDFVWND